jgi:hypothetical protein
MFMVSACIVITEPDGEKSFVVEEFSTFTELKIEQVKQCAEGNLKHKVPELFRAIQGFFEAHHRYQLNMLMRTIEHLEGEIESITQRLEHILAPNQGLIDQLDEVPGNHGCLLYHQTWQILC